MVEKQIWLQTFIITCGFVILIATVAYWLSEIRDELRKMNEREK